MDFYIYTQEKDRLVNHRAATRLGLPVTNYHDDIIIELPPKAQGITTKKVIEREIAKREAELIILKAALKDENILKYKSKFDV